NDTRYPLRSPKSWICWKSWQDWWLSSRICTRLSSCSQSQSPSTHSPRSRSSAPLQDQTLDTTPLPVLQS
ncbi:hypothetical protein BGZ74_011549, partial [Mortierella antarctica]